MNPNEPPRAEGQIGLSDHFGIPVYSVHVKQFAEHQAALRDYFLAMRQAEDGIHKSNVNGWHSREDLFLEDDEHVCWLTNKIRNVAVTAAQHFHGERRQGKPVLAACWANISEAGDWNSPHQHLPADWSGVFYIDAEPECEPAENGVGEGDLMFFNPMPMGRRWDSYPTVSYRPVNGRLLIFPAYATHMVTPHRRERPRISVSFNLFWESPKID